MMIIFLRVMMLSYFFNSLPRMIGYKLLSFFNSLSTCESFTVDA